jgi:hypothetical protein
MTTFGATYYFEILKLGKATFPNIASLMAVADFPPVDCSIATELSKPK